LAVNLKRETDSKLMADSAGILLALCATSALPHEVTLVGETLVEAFVL